LEASHLYFLISHSLSNFLAGAYVVWVFEDICSKVLSPLLNKLFRVLEASLLLYLLLRIVSVSLVDTPVSWYHACWYGWYPCFFTSAFATLAITYTLDKGDSIKKLPNIFRYLASLIIICCIIVLTNDYHNLCFSFEPNGREFISHNGPLIIPVKLAIILQYAGAIVHLLYLAYSAGYWRKRLALPGLIALGAVFYNCLYTYGYPYIVNTEHIAINTFFVALFWQAASKARLFPCYGYYVDLYSGSSSNIAAEASYHIRKSLTRKTELVLQTETPRLKHALELFQSPNATSDSKRITLHSLKLSLSFIKKHCLLYLQLETKGYVEATDFIAALQESLIFANEAGCKVALFSPTISHLSVQALLLHRIWNNILHKALNNQPEALLFQISQSQQQLQLICSVPVQASTWLDKLSRELKQEHKLVCEQKNTEDGAFLKLSIPEVPYE